MKPQAAVLTGDLIGSTETAPEAVEAAMARIKTVADRISKMASFERHRGDGWQLYLESPGIALAVMLLIAADLRAVGGLESRIALGLGGAYFNSFKNLFAVRDLYAANGSAFVSSGRALDKMPKSQRLALAGEGTDILHQRLISMIDDRISNWSREQAEAVALALSPEGALTQSQIAARLGISRQAVAARLHAAGFSQINGAATDFLHKFGAEPPHA